MGSAGDQRAGELDCELPAPDLQPCPSRRMDEARQASDRLLARDLDYNVSSVRSLYRPSPGATATLRALSGPAFRDDSSGPLPTRSGPIPARPMKPT